MSPAIRLIVVAFILHAGVLPPALVYAQDSADEKTKSDGAAEKSYAAGVKAFDAGNSDAAIEPLSVALRQGGLPPPQMAKALFYRGSAYRKQGKPAQAISDLTSAVWLKGGLSDADRATAQKEREAAYREAGLGDKVPDGLTPGATVESSAPGQKVAIGTEAAAPDAPAARAPATSAWQTTAAATEGPANGAAVTPSSQTPPASTTWAAAAPPPTAGLSALPAESVGAGNSDGPAASTGNSFSSVGTFFSNLFSSNASPSAEQQTAAPAQVATATPITPVTTGSTTPESSVSSGADWGTATAVAEQQTATVLAPAADPLPAPAKADTSPVADGGKFKLQVAALRSESDAQAVVTRLKDSYSGTLGPAEPEIDAAVIGNMGTFYRVRIGPFADTEQPRQLCARLKPDGFDCLVVTQ